MIIQQSHDNKKRIYQPRHSKHPPLLACASRKLCPQCFAVAGEPSLVLLGYLVLTTWVGHLPTPILVVLLGLLSLSSMTLVSTIGGMWAITYLMLGAPTAVAPLNRAASLSVMSRLSISIAGHSRLMVAVLASTCIIVGIVVPERPLEQLLRMDVPSLILLSLDFVLLIKVVIPFLHRHLHIHCSAIPI